MKQTRFQPLEPLNQELEALLYDTDLTIQITDFTKETEFSYVLKKVQTTLDLFKCYAKMIESKLYPAINDYEPALVAILRDDYNSSAQKINGLEKFLSTPGNAFNSLENILFGAGLLERYREFTEHWQYQMNDHETMINRVFWRYYPDQELMQFSATLTAVFLNFFSCAIHTSNNDQNSTATINQEFSLYPADQSNSYSVLMI